MNYHLSRSSHLKAQQFIIKLNFESKLTVQYHNYYYGNTSHHPTEKVENKKQEIPQTPITKPKIEPKPKPKIHFV